MGILHGKSLCIEQAISKWKTNGTVGRHDKVLGGLQFNLKQTSVVFTEHRHDDPRVHCHCFFWEETSFMKHGLTNQDVDLSAIIKTKDGQHGW